MEIEERWIGGTKYYIVYTNGEFYNIKEESIKLYLEIDEVTEEDIEKYIEKYF